MRQLRICVNKSPVKIVVFVVAMPHNTNAIVLSVTLESIVNNVCFWFLLFSCSFCLIVVLFFFAQVLIFVIARNSKEMAICSLVEICCLILMTMQMKRLLWSSLPILRMDWCSGMDSHLKLMDKGRIICIWQVCNKTKEGCFKNFYFFYN